MMNNEQGSYNAPMGILGDAGRLFWESAGVVGRIATLVGMITLAFGWLSDSGALHMWLSAVWAAAMTTFAVVAALLVNDRRRVRPLRLAAKYGGLFHGGWKRQVEWAAGIPTAPQETEAWRQRVSGELRSDFDPAVEPRFNRGAATYTAGVPQQLADHIHRLDTLGEMIQEMRDGRLT